MIEKLLPPSIAKDENIRNLAKSAEGVFSFLFAQSQNPIIYARLDELQEEVLDLLAWQFHIEGYELARNRDEKIALIKKAVELHRYKGTKYAIKLVLESLGLKGEIREWFEIGGEPYTFRVYVSGVKDERLWRNLRHLIDEYKNERSWYTIDLLFSADNTVYISHIAPHGYVYKVLQRVAVDVAESTKYTASVQNTAYVYKVLPHSPHFDIAQQNIYAGTVMHQAIKLEVGNG